MDSDSYSVDFIYLISFGALVIPDLVLWSLANETFGSFTISPSFLSTDLIAAQDGPGLFCTFSALVQKSPFYQGILVHFVDD
jgi:hypothetical protein